TGTEMRAHFRNAVKIERNQRIVMAIDQLVIFSGRQSLELQPQRAGRHAWKSAIKTPSQLTLWHGLAFTDARSLLWSGRFAFMRQRGRLSAAMGEPGSKENSDGYIQYLASSDPGRDRPGTFRGPRQGVGLD